MMSGDWAFWKWLGHEGRGHMIGNSVLIIESPHCSVALPSCGDTARSQQ